MTPYYEHAGMTIICGDSREELAAQDSRSVDLVFADPPYNIGVDYGRGACADLLPPAEYLNWCREWMFECYHILTDIGTMWVMINDEWAGHFSVILEELGFHQRNWIKWYETFGVNCVNKFNRTSRHIFYCVKDSKQLVFHSDAVMRPSARQSKYRDKRASWGGKVWDDVWQIPRLVGSAQERIKELPTQLPLAILRPIIACTSNPGDLVLDPFMGSGTTLRAAKDLGRKAIGIEIEEKYCEIAAKRLGQEIFEFEPQEAVV